MLQDTNLFIDSSNYCVEDAIEYINKFIEETSEKEVSIDISKYNFLEATNICILSSTTQFALNPENKITWIVNSNDTQKTISRLKLKNISLEVRNNILLSDVVSV